MKTQNDDPRWNEASEEYNAGNWAEALFLLKSMADDGNKATYSRIARICEYGYNGRYGPDNGVKQDFSEALRWYRKAWHESADVSGAVGLARMYFEGKGVEKDTERAFNYLFQVKKYHISAFFICQFTLSFNKNKIHFMNYIHKNKIHFMNIIQHYFFSSQYIFHIRKQKMNN
ncbi:MAG: sel1 repeat family protein [Desulfobacteraceae bacterium]|nr:sel1 repeat family protein [Desulfobacteraceae bacterium]